MANIPITKDRSTGRKHKCTLIKVSCDTVSLEMNTKINWAICIFRLVIKNHDWQIKRHELKVVNWGELSKFCFSDFSWCP